MAKLTDRRREILEYIERHTQDFGYPPTVREIGKAVSLNSPSTVHAHLRKLEDEGLIRRQDMLTRAIRSLRDAAGTVASAAGMVQAPVLGRVAAGAPILADQNVEGHFAVPANMVGGARAFLLHVSGESMIEDGIHDGDYVLVREQPTADNGDIVVALMDGEGTVKRFYREKDRIRLQPANSSMDPFYARDVQVVGKVVGLFRNLN